MKEVQNTRKARYSPLRLQVGNKIRSLRTQYSMSRKDLAAEIGDRSEKDCPQTRIEDWEKGKNLPSTEDLLKLADIFDVSVDYILCKSDYRNVENADIEEITGLSEDSIELLRNMNNPSEAVFADSTSDLADSLNMLLMDDRFLDVCDHIASARLQKRLMNIGNRWDDLNDVEVKKKIEEIEHIAGSNDLDLISLIIKKHKCSIVPEKAPIETTIQQAAHGFQEILLDNILEDES